MQLPDILELDADAARSQWAEILQRDPTRKRQPPYTPVELVLSFGLFWVLRPNRFGGGNIDKVPDAVKRLAACFCRSPGSIINKLLNFDGSRANGGRHEREVYRRFMAAPFHYLERYKVALFTGWSQGLTPQQLPDFLDHAQLDPLSLLGQEELVALESDPTLGDQIRALARQTGESELETSRVVLQRARMGQHLFARRVLNNYQQRCAFCGLDLQGLRGHRLLTASHIKPWRASTNKERLDPANGVAACPTHDSAFDTGLLTVNGGFLIHRAELLQQAMGAAQVETYFAAPTLQDRLLIPDQPSARPARRYLEYHQQAIFQGQLNAH